MACTACIVCLISTFNGCSKKRSLGWLMLVAGTKQTLSYLFVSFDIYDYSQFSIFTLWLVSKFTYIFRYILVFILSKIYLVCIYLVTRYWIHLYLCFQLLLSPMSSMQQTKNKCFNKIKARAIFIFIWSYGE